MTSSPRRTESKSSWRPPSLNLAGHDRRARLDDVCWSIRPVFRGCTVHASLHHRAAMQRASRLLLPALGCGAQVVDFSERRHLGHHALLGGKGTADGRRETSPVSCMCGHQGFNFPNSRVFGGHALLGGKAAAKAVSGRVAPRFEAGHLGGGAAASDLRAKEPIPKMGTGTSQPIAMTGENVHCSEPVPVLG